ncbi:hypothetical protein U1Q18_050635 [Sarracenia purpurea var. burkii]
MQHFANSRVPVRRFVLVNDVEGVVDGVVGVVAVAFVVVVVGNSATLRQAAQKIPSAKLNFAHSEQRAPRSRHVFGITSQNYASLGELYVVFCAFVVVFPYPPGSLSVDAVKRMCSEEQVQKGRAAARRGFNRKWYVYAVYSVLLRPPPNYLLPVLCLSYIRSSASAAHLPPPTYIQLCFLGN